MDITYFFEQFKKKVTEIMKDEYIGKENDFYDKPSWTYLIGIAIYNIIKDYNDKNTPEYYIVAEDNIHKKRADFSIFSWSDNKKVFEIEHENDLTRIPDTYEKLIKSRAKIKLIIGYSIPKIKKELIITDLKNIKQMNNVTENIYLIIAQRGILSGEGYSLIGV